jgi:photosystem II stability/assembly factor-like uncharacterized protein
MNRRRFLTLEKTMFNRMMQSGILLSIATVVAISASGCTLVTPPPPDKYRPLGNDLIINEVFTLPPDRYYAYSWIEMYNPTDRTIPWFDESFPASLNCVGENGTFILTENDGQTWTTPPAVPSGNLNALDFPYPDTGYVGGDNGAMYRVVRIAGEYQFTQVTVPATENINAISSIPLTVSAFAAGNRGTILRTTTRGQTWVAQNSQTTKNIRALKMATVSRIFGCGDSGLVLRSVSSGQWSRLTVPEAFQTTHFYTIGVTGSLGDTAWVAGENGAMLLSRNVGATTPTWFAETTNTGATLRGSYFVPGTTRAWAVGDSGTIIFKRETGRAWVKQTSGTTATLRTVSFIDRDRGWAAGDGGVMLYTTNGGTSWRSLNSGTTENLKGLYNLPLNIRILNRYVLQMYAQRKQFFFDPTTGTINFDYIVKQDTGWLYFDPEILRQQAGGDPPDDIPQNGFVIINSDSARFQEHTDIGPGRTNILNFSIGFYYDSTNIFGVTPVLWDLLQSGEVRLIKQFFRVRTGTGEFLGIETETVDVVRWEGFMPTEDMLPVDPIYPDPGPELIFPQNLPADYIPEWWSLSRFGDDVGTTVEQQSTNGSFYMSDRPVPGYYSQINKNK